MKRLLVLVTLILLISNIASAWGPYTHFSKFKKALDDATIISPIKDACLANYDACVAGIEAADVSVIYYYTAFQDYQSLHDWNYQTKLKSLASTPEQEAFAIGYGVHLVQDTVSHNFYVPDKIRTTKIPNALLHPVIELKIDPMYYSADAPHMLDKIDQFVPLMNEASGGEKDWSSEATILRTAIGGEKFYTDGYNPGDSTLYFKFLSGLMKVVENFVTTDSSIDYDSRLDEATKDYFNGINPVFDPSGAQALRNADKVANIWKWVLGTLILIILFILTKRLRLW